MLHSLKELEIVGNHYSVVSAQDEVFTKKLSKSGKILIIFDKLDEIKSQWILKKADFFSKSNNLLWVDQIT